MKYILLVRHAQSKGNVDRSHYKTVPDHAVALTEAGIEQAKGVRDFIVGWLDAFTEPRNDRIDLWCSPYERTRHTAHIIGGGRYQSIGDSFRKSPFLISIGVPTDDFTIVEQNAGLFDGLTEPQCAQKYPHEWATYDLCRSIVPGRFYARAPSGESPLDVAIRTKEFSGRLLGSHEDINIVVSHGVTLRTILMNLCGKTPHWYHEEPNPPNASVRLLSAEDGARRYCDEGFIFRGYDRDGKLISPVLGE